MKDLEPFMVKFRSDGSIRPKEYFPDCAIRSTIRCSIIVIIHDECTFSANDRKRQAWVQLRHFFLRPKDQRQRSNYTKNKIDIDRCSKDF